LATAEAEYLWPGLNHSVGICGVAPPSVGVGGTFLSHGTSPAATRPSRDIATARLVSPTPILRISHASILPHTPRRDETRGGSKIADQEHRIDVLINNAGALFARRRLTKMRKQWSISRPRRTWLRPRGNTITSAFRPRRRRRHATTDLLCCCGRAARYWPA
jgi:hypothetical protein